MLEHIVQMGPMGVPSAAAETARNLEHSIANAGLPNITLVGACPAEGRRWVGAGHVVPATAHKRPRMRSDAKPTVRDRTKEKQS